MSRALRRGGAPPGKRPRARGSILDPYKPAIDRLLQAEVWNAVVIQRELQDQGYPGEVSFNPGVYSAQAAVACEPGNGAF